MLTKNINFKNFFKNKKRNNIIQKTLGDSVEETTSSSSSVEDSILRKIQSK